MSDLTFEDIKIGDGLRLNGYPMELLAVGNLLVADHQRVEIVILQKLEGSPGEYLVELMRDSGMAPGVLKNIIAAHIGRDTFRTPADLNEQETQTAILAVESAIADDEQMKEEGE